MTMQTRGGALTMASSAENAGTAAASEPTKASWTADDGEALRSHRKARSDSQTDVGEFMKAHNARHRSQSFVSRVETGTKVPTGADEAALRAYLAMPAGTEDGGGPNLRLLDQLLEVSGSSHGDPRVDQLAQVLQDRLASTSGSFNEYDWYVVQALFQTYQS